MADATAPQPARQPPRTAVTAGRPRRTNADWQAVDRAVLWHPFTQMRGWGEEDFPVILSGDGCWLEDADGRRYIDGVSSLWCAVHGHRVPRIDAAVRDQLDRVAHSTLLGLGGEPSIALAEQLVEIAPGDLARVFYSDSGSTAVEIALKMAFQFWQLTEGADCRRTRFLRLEGAYHGDTIGSVSVGGIDLFHQIFHPLLFHTTEVPVPRGPSAAQRAADAPRCLEALDAILQREGEELAALIVEPGVQGASGIRVYPDGFTRAIVERARAAGLLVILDEVATGVGRSGPLFAAEREDVEPDLLCLAKGLSGGYLPLAATLTTERIYAAFLGEYEDFKTFFHGHTFTGNALACAAALASLELCREPAFAQRAVALGEELDAAFAPLWDHPHVLEIRRYGSMLGIELVARRGPREIGGPVEDVVPFPTARRTGHRAAVEARERGVIIRPLGDTVVVMPPLCIAPDEVQRLAAVTMEAVDLATRGS